MYRELQHERDYARSPPPYFNLTWKSICCHLLSSFRNDENASLTVNAHPVICDMTLWRLVRSIGAGAQDAKMLWKGYEGWDYGETNYFITKSCSEINVSNKQPLSPTPFSRKALGQSEGAGKRTVKITEWGAWY